MPTCEDCRAWVYDPKRNWERTEKPRGNPLRRIRGSPTPCAVCPKAIDNRPAPEADLSDRNWQAWRHYQECRATGQFPADALVRRNAGLIRQIEDQAARADMARLVQAMTAAAVMGGLQRGSRT